MYRSFLIVLLSFLAYVVLLLSFILFCFARLHVVCPSTLSALAPPLVLMFFIVVVHFSFIIIYMLVFSFFFVFMFSFSIPWYSCSCVLFFVFYFLVYLLVHIHCIIHFLSLVFFSFLQHCICLYSFMLSFGGARKTMGITYMLLFIDKTRKQRRGEIESIYQGDLSVLTQDCQTFYTHIRILQYHNTKLLTHDFTQDFTQCLTQDLRVTNLLFKTQVCYSNLKCPSPPLR